METTWEKLISLCKQHGFSGKSVADLEAWAKKKYEGKTVMLKLKGGVRVSSDDFEELYDAHLVQKKTEIAVSDDGVDDGVVEIVDKREDGEDDDGYEDDDDPMAEKRRKNRADRHRQQLKMTPQLKSMADGEDQTRTKMRGTNDAERMANIMACKAYNKRAARGETRFSDSDVAEALTAKRRLGMSCGEEYAGRARDVEMVKYWTAAGVLSTKAGSMYDATLGGVFVPETMGTEVIRNLPGYGTAREAVGIYPMATAKEWVPRILTDVQFTRTAESVASSETQPGVDLVKLEAEEVTGLIVMPSRLMEQSAINLADILDVSVDNSKKEYEDRAFWNGVDKKTGQVEWNGLTNQIGANSYYTVSGLSAYSAITITQVQTWRAGLPDKVDQFEDDIEIACHRSVDQVLFQKFLLTAGGAQRDEITGKPSSDFQGTPVRHVNVMPNSTFSSGALIALTGPLRAACKMGQVVGSERYFESNHRFMEKRQWAALVGFDLAINCHDVDNTADSMVRALRATS